MSEKKVIGLCGPIGVGKTTTARGLVELYREQGLSAEIIPFAQDLKRKVQLLIGITAQEMEEHKISGKKFPVKIKITSDMGLSVETEMTVREALQFVGTDMFRRFKGADVWAEAWTEAARASDCDVIIADDVRFPNEAAAVKSLVGKVIRLCPWVGYIPPAEAGAHPSEKAMAGFSGYDIVHYLNRGDSAEDCFNLKLLLQTPAPCFRDKVTAEIQAAFNEGGAAKVYADVFGKYLEDDGK